MSRAELNARKSQMAEEISLLKDRLARDKRILLERNRREIGDVRRRHRDQLQTERASSEALVNHIRSKSRRELSELRADSENKILKEQDLARKTYENLKIEKERVRSNHARQIASERERFTDRIESVKKDKTKVIEAEKKQVDQFKQDQARLKEKIRQEFAEESSDLHRTHANSLDGKQRQYQKELASLSIKHEKQMQKETADFNNRATDMRQKANHRLKSREGIHAKRIEDQRLEYNTALNKMSDNYKLQRAEIIDRSEAQKEDLQNQTKRELERKKTIGDGRRQKLEAELQRGLTNVRRKANHIIGQEKARQDNRLHIQKTAHEKKWDDTNQVWNKRFEKQQKSFEEKLASREATMQENLIKQREEFETQFLKNKKNNEQAFENQSLKLIGELNNIQRGFMKQFKEIEGRKDDPFYRMENYGSQLKDVGRGYVFKTYIPSHERDNVSVRVQKDRVVLSGERKYSGNIESTDKSSRKVTNNYQTFREEFKFADPVQEEQIVEQWDGNYLEVLIPKRFWG